MHPARILVAIVLFSALCFATAASGRTNRGHRCAHHHRCQAAKRVSCHPRGAKILAERAGTRVFAVANPGGGEYSSGGTVYGCLLRKHRAVVLTKIPDATSATIDMIQISGSFVAYHVGTLDEACGHYSGGNNCGGDAIEAFDVRTAKRRVEVAAAPGQLVLSSNGWVAWSSSSAPPALTLFAFDSSGRRTLDSGSIDPNSLRAEGSTISWVNGGRAQSAPLR